VTTAGAVALDPAAVLDALLRHPSPTGSVDVAAQALAAMARDAGFATSVDFAGCVVMSWGDTGLPIAGAIVLLGPLYTVPGGLRVAESNGRLHGRGSVGAKGPLAAAFAAVSRLPREGRRVTIVAAIDEEGASACAQALSRTAPASHLIVLEPSGWDAITVGYRGCVRLCVSLEQTSAHHALPRASACDLLVARLVDVQQRLRGLVSDLGVSEGDRAVDRLQVRVNSISSGTDGGVERAEAHVEVRLPAGVSVADVLARVSAACDG
jgi:LysW-gamma-L-lysine carboxypeptidase